MNLDQFYDIFMEAQMAGALAGDQLKAHNFEHGEAIAIHVFPATPKMKGLEGEFSYWLYTELERHYDPLSKSIIIWAAEFDSIEKNQAYANAFIEVLKTHKIEANLTGVEAEC